jgi:DNA-directed RNA polymerase omega subunit
LIQIPDNIDSKYRFVILSALRARQIQGGSRPMIKEPRHKATQIAQRELIQGLVKFRVGSAGESRGEENLEQEEVREE